MSSQKYNNSEILNIAINDFLQVEKVSKLDSVFSVDIMVIDENIIGVSIISALNKLIPTARNEIGSNHPNFPTQYCIINSKLFYWYDSTASINTKLIKALSQFHQIDSMNVNEFVEFPETLIDDSKKGVDYYFCRNNINKYKRVITSRGLGYYKTPKLRCRCKH